MELEILIERLSKIGIKIECDANYPWIYLRKINNKIVKEKYYSEHAFTIAFTPIKKDGNFQFTNISKTFELIRKYCG